MGRLNQRRWLLVAVTVLALAAGMLASRYWQPTQPAVTPLDYGETTFTDLDGRPAELSRWRGKVMLLNFWATWCPPCRDEIPLLNDAHERYAERGFTVVGVAIDDAAKVREFSDELFIAYPVLLGDRDSIDVMHRFGNRIGALPYSVLFDRDGTAVASKHGEFTRAELDALIESRL